jgi:arsenate reductase
MLFKLNQYNHPWVRDFPAGDLLYSAAIYHPPRRSDMSAVTIYHNPRCSKSRNSLALLEENGIEPKVVLYLETQPQVEELAGLLQRLGLTAQQLVRRGEQDYKACKLSEDSTEDEILAAMATHPKLIERPIVVKGERAVLGRPPENVLGLIG